VWTSHLRGLPLESDLQPLLTVAATKQFAVDAVIVAEGVELDSLYFVRSGVCRVCCRSGRGFAQLGKLVSGDVFGEVSFLLGGAASASVIAHTAVTVVELRRDVLRSTFAVRPDLACKFYKWFAATNLRRLERNEAVLSSAVVGGASTADLQNNNNNNNNSSSNSSSLVMGPNARGQLAGLTFVFFASLLCVWLTFSGDRKTKRSYMRSSRRTVEIDIGSGHSSESLAFVQVLALTVYLGSGLKVRGGTALPTIEGSPSNGRLSFEPGAASASLNALL
jgi:CRP-like cAMP-binding protein